MNGSLASLELDIERYVVPAPTTSANSGIVYADNMTKTPRSLNRGSIFPMADGSSISVHTIHDGGNSVEQPTKTKEMEIIVTDPSMVCKPSGMVESKSVATFSPLQKQYIHRGLFVDRGLGSPRLVKSCSSATFTIDVKPESEAKNPMPAAAAGAVGAAAVAEQVLGPKEDRHLAIVLVGLVARGKTFTAAKLMRYSRWLGYDTKNFNFGKVIGDYPFLISGA